MKFKKIRLRLATSEMIRKWARRYLPNGKIINGQILNSETINYQTLKPEKDGLFCERIFGPVNDYICACGINSKRGHKFCPQCEVEYISSRVRRYRLGYIQFISAVAHIWFLKSNYFSLFLNVSKEKIDSLLYCTQNISRTIFPDELKPVPEGVTKISKFFILPLPPLPPPKRTKRTKRIKKKKKNFEKLLLRDVFASANLLSFNFKFRRFSKFWNFEKQEKHPIEYLLLNWQIQYTIQIQPLQKNKKSIWKNGGLKDSALFFGFSVISKMVSWKTLFNWLSFVSFFIKFPQKKDRLNKFYPGPPGVVYLCKSQLFCLTGAQIIRTWLTQITQYGFNDGKLLEIQIQLNLLKIENFKPSFELFLYKIYLYRRLKYLRSFRYAQMNPASMVLSVFPVLPPDLRPIVTLSKNKTSDEKDEIVVSDLNKLYQNVILRNKRLLYITKFNSNFHCLNSETVQYSQRLLQESVDSLIENSEKKDHDDDDDHDQENESDTTNNHSSKNNTKKNAKTNNKDKSESKNTIDDGINNNDEIDDKIYHAVYHEIYHEIDSDIFNEIYNNNNDIENDDIDMEKNMENIKNKYIKNNNNENSEDDIDNVDNNVDPENKNEIVKKDSDLKSLSDLFKGKKGRFRQNLLGKRVDYSGRSVIVVGPSLKIYECGLPIEIAFELFQPFLIQRLIFKKYAKTIGKAKRILNKKTKFIWNLLKDVVRSHPILLNRAPTLHRLSIQTFKPILVDGKAILLHPLVCAAFNADFDGDQMGVHIPLCFQAQAEAWKINWSQNNLFSIATHAPTCSPSQDIILGSSFLTIRNIPKRWTKKVSFKFLKNLLFQKPFFSKTSKMFSKQIRDILLSNIALICLSKNFLPNISNHNFIWCNLNPYISGYETEKKVQKLIEIRLNSDGNFQKFRHELCQQYHFSGAEILRKIRTTYGQLKFYQNLV